MKSDYNRYIAEYVEGDLKKQLSDDALKTYDDAAEISKTLLMFNPIKNHIKNYLILMALLIKIETLFLFIVYSKKKKLIILKK